MNRENGPLSRQWSGLTLQLFFLVLLPLTALLLAVAIGSSLLHQQGMRTLVGERDERSARAAAAAVGEQLNQRAAAVQGLAQRAAQMETPSQALADVTPLLPSFDQGLGLFTDDGTLLATSGPRDQWPALLPDLPLSPQDENEQDGVSFTLLPSDQGSGEAPTLVVTAGAGGFFAAGALSPTALIRNALSRVFSGGGSATAFVATESGQVLFRSGPPLAPETTILQHPGVVSALRGESGTTYLSANESEHVIAFSPVLPVGWALVIEEPWQEVTDPLLRTTEWAPLILVPLLLIAIIGLGFGARQVVQPLRSLEQKATALAWGDFEAIEEPVGGIAEIHRLQSELVHMAHKVKGAQESLRSYLGAVTAGQEEERRRLARELHDETIQSLIALNQRIQLAQLSQEEGPQTAQLDEMEEMVSRLVADLRRQIQALRPIYLEDLGLGPALQMLAQETSQSEDLSVTFQSAGRARRLQPEIELALFRIAQAALSNVVRHAAATSATVRLVFEPQDVTLEVRDDGRGFVVPDSPAEMAPRGHFGLLGMHERAELIGATLTLRSEPGEGARLKVTVPQGLQR